MKSKQSWTDEEAGRRLTGQPSAEKEKSAEKFFSSISSQGKVTDEEALEILQGRQPKNAVRESTSQKRSEKASRDPIVRQIEIINSQIQDVLEASRRQDFVREFLNAKNAR